MKKIQEKGFDMPKAFRKVYDSKGIAAVRSFMDGPLFPVLVGAIVLLCSLCSCPLFGLAVFLLAGAFIFFFSEDMRPALPLALLVFFLLDYYRNTDLYRTTKAIAVYLVFGIPALCGLVFRFFCFERQKSKRRLLLGLVLMCAGFLLGGIFTKYYKIYNFYKSLGLLLAFCAPYLVFSFTMRYKEDNFSYIARICAIAACVIAVQLLQIYVRFYKWGAPLDDVWKGKILFGWGISNTAGELMAFFIPAIFYLVYKEKRGYLYYFLLLFIYIAIWFTLSRNALLFGTLTIGCGVLINCFIGRHRQAHRRLMFVLLGLFAVGLALLIATGKFEALFTFFTQNKFNDRGRFKLWKDYLRYFKENPVFGVGYAFFKQLYYNPWVDTAWQAHNTIVQALGSTGLVGLALYLFHRAQTVTLFVKKPKAERLFLGGCILVGLLQSLLDPLFFRLYFALFYSSMLFIIEQSLEQDMQSKEEKSPDKALAS